MYILAPVSDLVQYSVAGRTAVRSAQYAKRVWYEVIGDVQTYVEACKRAEIYYQNFAGIGGIPFIFEVKNGLGVFVDAARFQQGISIEEHIQLVQQVKLARPLLYNHYSDKERIQFHYPLNARLNS